jgi:hypothetical protein
MDNLAVLISGQLIAFVEFPRAMDECLKAYNGSLYRPAESGVKGFLVAVVFQDTLGKVGFNQAAGVAIASLSKEAELGLGYHDVDTFEEILIVIDCDFGKAAIVRLDSPVGAVLVDVIVSLVAGPNLIEVACRL